MTHVDTPLKVLSLCSGIGGLDLGLGRALNTRVVACVERDPFAASILMDRMEESALDPCPIWVGDLRELDAKPLAGSIDMVIGGYPCQPFSNAGQRKGEDDPRHLWPTICDLIRTIRPRFALFENVSGHVRLGFDAVLADLASLGFDVRWGSVRASDPAIGAPHRRERLFILAWDATLERVPDGWLLPRMADTERVSHERRGEPGIIQGEAGEVGRDVSQLDAAECESHGLADPDRGGCTPEQHSRGGTEETAGGEGNPVQSRGCTELANPAGLRREQSAHGGGEEIPADRGDGYGEAVASSTAVAGDAECPAESGSGCSDGGVAKPQVKGLQGNDPGPTEGGEASGGRPSAESERAGDLPREDEGAGQLADPADDHRRSGECREKAGTGAHRERRGGSPGLGPELADTDRIGRDGRRDPRGLGGEKEKEGRGGDQSPLPAPGGGDRVAHAEGGEPGESSTGDRGEGPIRGGEELAHADSDGHREPRRDAAQQGRDKSGHGISIRGSGELAHADNGGQHSGDGRLCRQPEPSLGDHVGRGGEHLAHAGGEGCEGGELSFPPGPHEDWRWVPDFLHPAVENPDRLHPKQSEGVGSGCDEEGGTGTRGESAGPGTYPRGVRQAEEIESLFCRVADGDAASLLVLAQLFRTDRLRALGNAVVPAQAEEAIRRLWPWDAAGNPIE